jgi:sensor histidine kinase YesM
LNNVEKRLNCYEKEQAHMHITSHPGIGTQIELVLPAITNAEAVKA